MDFTKFDVTKLFDVDTVLGQLEKQTMVAVSFITEPKSRKLVETMSVASFDFARANAAASKAFGESVKKAFEIKA